MVGPIERNVNVAQEIFSSVATHGTRIAAIITRTVRDVAREVNDAVADGFELAEANRRARADDEAWDGDENLVDTDSGADDHEEIDAEVVETEQVDDDLERVADVEAHEPHEGAGEPAPEHV